MIRLFAAILALLTASAASAQVVIDTQSARAVLAAVANPALTEAEAERIADLPGNKGLIRKQGAYNDAIGRKDFIAALLAAALRTAEAGPFGFSRLRGRERELSGALDAAADPALLARVGARVGRYAAPGFRPKGTAYLIVGGTSSGFAFGDPELWVRVTDFVGDAPGLESTLAHELFHMAQAALAGPSAATFFYESERDGALTGQRAHDCYRTRAFFGNLVVEGTASLVGDEGSLPERGPYSAKARAEHAAQAGRMAAHATLLEMSLAAITGPEAVPFDDVYAVGFYSPAPLYALGEAMARAIANADGDRAVSSYFTQPPEAFVRRYIELSDAAPPTAKLAKLGSLAHRWAARASCPADPPATPR
jgi:hypothetical protein